MLFVPLDTTSRVPRRPHALPVQRARTELAQAYQIATCAILARMRKTQPLRRAPVAGMACFRQDLGKPIATSAGTGVTKMLLAAPNAMTVRQAITTAYTCKARTASPVIKANIRQEWRKPTALHAGAGIIRLGPPKHRAMHALLASTSLARDSPHATRAWEAQGCFRIRQARRIARHVRHAVQGDTGRAAAATGSMTGSAPRALLAPSRLPRAGDIYAPPARLARTRRGYRSPAVTPASHVVPAASRRVRAVLPQIGCAASADRVHTPPPHKIWGAQLARMASSGALQAVRPVQDAGSAKLGSRGAGAAARSPTPPVRNARWARTIRAAWSPPAGPASLARTRPDWAGLYARIAQRAGPGSTDSPDATRRTTGTAPTAPSAGPRR